MTEDNYTEIGEWLISHYEATMKRKEYKDANAIFSLIVDFGTIHDMTTLKDEALKRVGIKDVKLDKAFSTPIGEQVKEVFYEIDKLRGYRPPKRNAEAASIQRMIRKGYNSKQIIACWNTLKQDKFWDNKELFLMTVESQIGAMTNKVNDKKPFVDPDKYIKGRYGHMVQR